MHLPSQNYTVRSKENIYMCEMHIIAPITLVMLLVTAIAIVKVSEDQAQI